MENKTRDELKEIGLEKTRLFKGVKIGKDFEKLLSSIETELGQAETISSVDSLRDDYRKVESLVETSDIKNKDKVLDELLELEEVLVHLKNLVIAERRKKSEISL